MARIQILPLTTVTVGTITETPFILVIDQADPETFSREALTALKADTGARSVLVTDDALTVENALELDDEARKAIEARLASATA